MEHMKGPFDVFERELEQMHSLSSGGAPSSFGVDTPSFPFHVLTFAFGLLERPLTNAIARPFLRRFTNKFLTSMLEAVPLSSGPVNCTATRIAFDVALLAYLYHVVNEAETMNFPHKVVGMFMKGVIRKITGKPGFIYIQVQRQLDRYALPWIIKTVAAYLYAARSRGYLSLTEVEDLLKRYQTTNVLAFRELAPFDSHPLAPHTIRECLKQPAQRGMTTYINEQHLPRIYERTRWNIGSSIRSYWDSPFTLSDYEPRAD